jgi:hypothetical protein
MENKIPVRPKWWLGAAENGTDGIRMSVTSERRVLERGWARNILSGPLGQVLGSSRIAQDSNLPGTPAPASGFRPGTLPTRSAIPMRRADESNATPAEARTR